MTPQPRDLAAGPKLAYSKAEAAATVSMSVDLFEREVMPHIRVVRVGRRVIVPVGELRSWLDREAALTLPDRGAS